MHYRNGREAKNGDKIVQIGGYGSGAPEVTAVGVLYGATPGNLAEVLKQAGLDKRPPGK